MSIVPLRKPLRTDREYCIQHANGLMNLSTKPQNFKIMKRVAAHYCINLTKDMLHVLALQILQCRQRVPLPQEYELGLFGEDAVLSAPMHDMAPRTVSRSVHQVWVEEEASKNLRLFFVVYSIRYSQIITIIPPEYVFEFDDFQKTASF